MRKSKVTDFLLCMGALVIGATVALLAALKAVEPNTAIVFLGLSVACIAMSLIDFEAPTGRSAAKKTRKK